MATAAEAAAPVDAPPENQEAAPVDYVAEAKKMGWVEPDEFKGEREHHIDAETFYNRAIEYMPIAKATIRKLSGRIDAMEKAARQSADFFSKAEERAYTKALDEIRAEQEAAVESGDVEAHRKAADKLDKLEKPSAPKAADISPEQRAEDFADWGKANKWYATNSVMQSYADAQAASLAKSKGGILDREDLDAVSEKVKAKFADEFPDDFGAAPKPKPRSAVEGVSSGRGRSSGFTYNDLPPEARATCDKWVKNGTIKSREDYVKSFDFKGWNA